MPAPRRVSSVYKALVPIVEEYKKVSLKTLRRELKRAYEDTHADDSDAKEEKPLNKYQVFVRRMTEKLKIEMDTDSQRERLRELGRLWALWKGHKATGASDEEAYAALYSEVADATDEEVTCGVDEAVDTVDTVDVTLQWCVPKQKRTKRSRR